MPARFDGVNVIRANMKAHPDKVADAVEGVLQYHGPQVLREAIQRKPWTDITGNARQTMNYQVGRGNEVTLSSLGPNHHTLTDRLAGNRDEIVLALAHGVYYGVFLELANDGVWGTILKTMDRNAPKIIGDIRKILR